MHIVIKNPAPLGDRLQKWGDYHFGASLADALSRERPNIEVRQDFWPEWDQKDEGNLLIVLRGKRSYVPRGNVPAFLWVISHPAEITASEIEKYTHILAGSQGFHDFVKNISRVPVTIARQCTDIDVFTAPNDDINFQTKTRSGMIFIANSRGFRRDIVQWALEAGAPPQLIGGQWAALGLSHLVQQVSVENYELPKLYRRSRFSLNDHWADMRHFGIINNRILDALACGLPVITDTFTELNEQFGDALLYTDGSAAFQNALTQGERDYYSLLERIAGLRKTIEQEYSFNVRAWQILKLIDNYGRAGAGALLASKNDNTVQSPENPPLMDRIVDEYFSAHAASGKHYRLLHLFPLHAREIVTGKNSPRYNYYSGGIGIGPWQLPLDKSLERIEGMNFDTILIDSAEALNRIEPLTRYLFLRGIGKAMSSAGVLVWPNEQAKSDWLNRLAHAGFCEASKLENWTLFHPPSSAVSESGSRELTSYARSLEYRLSAVYKSTTWKVMQPLRNAGAKLKRKKSGVSLPKRPSLIDGKDPLDKWRS